MIGLRIQNVGTGYATAVEFTGDLSFKPTVPFNNEKTLEEMEPFKSGINHLGAEYKIDTPMFLQNEMIYLPEQLFDIGVSYKDSTGTPDKKKFHFEVGHWENMSQFIVPEKVTL